jgi:hypothetical protein
MSAVGESRRGIPLGNSKCLQGQVLLLIGRYAAQTPTRSTADIRDGEDERLWRKVSSRRPSVPGVVGCPVGLVCLANFGGFALLVGAHPLLRLRDLASVTSPLPLRWR